MSDCIEWAGKKNDAGYGWISTRGKKKFAHRIALEEKLGRPLGPGMCALHNCPDGDNPSCVNPDHLWEGTQGDNVRDMVAKGRHLAAIRPEAIPSGEQHWHYHKPESTPRGEAHWKAKLTESDVRAIRQRLIDGALQKDVASEFGVSGGAIHLIAQRKSWAHVV